jgi:4-aminobutyrate aminotransferase/(S)-3-amino-2-methylpropionate transaminase
LVDRAAQIGSVMLPRLAVLQEKFDAIGDIRGRGAMVAIEIVKDRATKEVDPAGTQRVAAACHAAGLVVLTCGTYGNVLRFLPPLVIPDHLLDEGLDILEEAFAATSGARD